MEKEFYSFGLLLGWLDGPTRSDSGARISRVMQILLCNSIENSDLALGPEGERANERKNERTNPGEQQLLARNSPLLSSVLCPEPSRVVESCHST